MSIKAQHEVQALLRERLEMRSLRPHLDSAALDTVDLELNHNCLPTRGFSVEEQTVLSALRFPLIHVVHMVVLESFNDDASISNLR